jgi:hypothetical protein
MGDEKCEVIASAHRNLKVGERFASKGYQGSQAVRLAHTTRNSGCN